MEPMTPGQISAVEATLAAVDLDRLTADFYRRAFAEDPSLSEMFTSDPAVQRARFAAELDEIVQSMRSMVAFESAVRALGERHRGYGVRAAHYRLMGTALLAALADALGDRWTADVEEAWALAYNLTAETMLLGAMECDS
jgi:hemoglobin-like flavoprotein